MEKKQHILVVEDELPLRQVLADKLVDEGFEVTKAVNGQDGLIAAIETRPDLIILDLVMPVMDGLTMLEELRRDEGYGKNAPVILLTNINDQDRVAQATEAGSYDYLVKSDWDLDDVVKRVRARLAMGS
jgi:DNA-binding response OmpR family regulator